MALQVAIQIPGTNITLNYWVPAAVSVDLLANETRLAIAGFVSKADFDAGKKPLTQGIRRFRWAGADNPVTPAVLQAGGAFTAIHAKVRASVPSAINLPGQEPTETNPFFNATVVP